MAIKKAQPLGPYDKRGVRKGRTRKLSLSLAGNSISRARMELVLYSTEFQPWELLNK